MVNSILQFTLEPKRQNLSEVEDYFILFRKNFSEIQQSGTSSKLIIKELENQIKTFNSERFLQTSISSNFLLKTKSTISWKISNSLHNVSETT
jgi:hypothetical protein